MAESVFKAILDQVQADIQGLNLAGIDSGSIRVVKVFSDIEEMLPTLPGVLIGPLDAETSPPQVGTNARDDIGYPIVVGMFAADSDDQVQNHDRNLLWRERIRRQFANRRLANVPSVYTCLLEPRTIVDPRRWLTRNLWASSLLLRFMSRETRL